VPVPPAPAADGELADGSPAAPEAGCPPDADGSAGADGVVDWPPVADWSVLGADRSEEVPDPDWSVDGVDDDAGVGDCAAEEPSRFARSACRAVAVSWPGRAAR
jgi:hypothetical protein